MLFENYILCGWNIKLYRRLRKKISKRKIESICHIDGGKTFIVQQSCEEQKIIMRSVGSEMGRGSTLPSSNFFCRARKAHAPREGRDLIKNITHFPARGENCNYRIETRVRSIQPVHICVYIRIIINYGKNLI